MEVQGAGSRRDLGFLGKPASRIRDFAVELAVWNWDLGETMADLDTSSGSHLCAGIVGHDNAK